MSGIESYLIFKIILTLTLSIQCDKKLFTLRGEINNWKSFWALGLQEENVVLGYREWVVSSGVNGLGKRDWIGEHKVYFNCANSAENLIKFKEEC